MKSDVAKICVIGLGPAGLGVALAIAHDSTKATDIICLDAGTAAEHRCCPTSQANQCDCSTSCRVITGVGGSSLMGGGKISFLPAGRGLIRVIGTQGEQVLREALDVLSRYFRMSPPRTVPTEVASKYYADIGFNYRYYEVRLVARDEIVRGYQRLVHELTNAGVNLSLETEVTRIARTVDGFIVSGQRNGEEFELLAENVVAATGRYGHDLLESLDESLDLGGGVIPLDYGVRLEFPVAVWPDIDRYHEDLKLEFGNSRTYCVCKDGLVVNYRVGDIRLLEGHSDTNQTTGFTNFGVLVRKPYLRQEEKDAVISEVRDRVRALAGEKLVRQSLLEFATGGANKVEFPGPGTTRLWERGDVGACWPSSEADELRTSVRYLVDRLLPKDHHGLVSVYAPELHNRGRKYPITARFRSRHDGLYLVGECTGHFRGILQSFCSGLWCGRHLLTEAWPRHVQSTVRV